MGKSKKIDLKEINKQQKDVIKNINNMILEYQQVFSEQPTELVISKRDFNILTDLDNDINMVSLGEISIYPVWERELK